MADQPTQKEYVQYIKDTEDALEHEKEKNRQLTKGQMSMFESIDEENLIKWQLDLSGDKEKIYHLLKGDKIEELGDGSIRYVTPDSIREIPFCDYGVSMLMQIINYYLTKNTILSNYDTQTINWKVFDFGHALIDYIHNHYEELIRIPTFKEAKDILLKKRMDEVEDMKEICRDFFGEVPKEKLLKDMNLLNEGKDRIMEDIKEIQKEQLNEKIKMIPLIHQAIVNTVHSAYLRAWRGGERESLRTARTVTQSEPIANFPYASPVVQPGAKHSLNPFKWGR